ncbi:hypothetical protein QF046_001399 [Microbacterium sp. W4I4]|uniref:hypothetical protein n=1 Tax=Microbacterium sp. W4I4 TaxID=3042295 RepID=UPI0027877D94|nr:hypothetical protein [Microbacterium sp. W4I4]MDQ0613758.1 hypothetical protein [Microbacterium sp. W4I4]
MGEMPETTIPLSVRIELCRAGLQVIADGLGIRMLHIKGATLDARIRPDAREGSDVDVIVDPRRVVEMHRALLAHGWTVYSTFDEGSPFGHAQTYWHPDWGYIDLHRRFPGIGLADATAFDVLARDSSASTAAGLDLVVPELAAQGALFLLNAARGSQGDRDAALAFRRGLAAEQLRSIDQLVSELHAEVAASVVTGELENWHGHRDYRLWRAVSQGGTRTQEWWGRVRAARSPQEAMQVVLRAPRVNRSRLAHQLGRTPTWRDVAMAAVRRGGRALRDLVPGWGTR